MVPAVVVVVECRYCGGRHGWAAWHRLEFARFEVWQGVEHELRYCSCGLGSVLSVECDDAWHRAPFGLTSREMVEAERSYERGLRVGTRRLGPMPDGTRDLWEDGW